MTNAIRNKTARRTLGASAIALSASMMLALTPTTASAFDIGGLIGAAMAGRMGQYHGGGGHRTHVSRHDSDTSDRGNSNVEHDARDPVPSTPSNSDKSDNHGGARQKNVVQGPSSPSGGTAQASDRDPATSQTASQIASAGKSFDDAPAFNPSR